MNLIIETSKIWILTQDKLADIILKLLILSNFSSKLVDILLTMKIWEDEQKKEDCLTNLFAAGWLFI